MLGLAIFFFGSGWIVKWSQYKGNTDIARLYCVLLGLVFFLQQITGYFNIFLVSLQRYDWQTKLNTAYLLSNGILGITLLKSFPHIITLALIQLGLSLLNCLCTGLIVTRILGFFGLPYWNKSLFLELWSFGKWVYLTQINAIFFNGFDKIILVSMFGSSSVPSYTFAQRIYSTVHGMIAGQSSYLFPMLASQGDKLETVAEQIEERLRWFIGLIAGFIYAGLIISGSALLTIIVNANFSRQASFQLFVFCWVGYIHANVIVPFFLGLSKGDAKGNWIYHMIIGLGYLPFFVVFASLFGFEYAVLGQLMTLAGTIYLSRRLHPKMNWKKFVIWLISPLYSSLLLMVVACIIYLIIVWARTNIWIQIATTIIFYLVAFWSIPRLETVYFQGRDRLKTLRKAMEVILVRFGVSGNLLFRIMGM
jgi:O-antigen/teichoic acid export membrane protein